MPNNSSLNNAARAKNDEFYTQYYDIEREVDAYLQYNPDIFKDKVILLPCDDPEWSNFTLFFAQKFKDLGLKKLISTSYAVESKKYQFNYQPTLFETSSPNYDEKKTRCKGKIFTLDEDINNDGKLDFKDLKWRYLEGDGDFRSEEVKKLRDEADIIVTNPPFSLFREFLKWIIEGSKKFLIIGNVNAIHYKDVFPYIKNNKIWLGATMDGRNHYFGVPNEYTLTEKTGKIEDGIKYAFVKGVMWFTNLDHGRRHKPLSLMTMADNLRFNKKIQEIGYPQYDNYDAIEVSFVDAIPSDYNGIMGVPQTFLNKYCAEQFEIIGMTDRQNTSGLRIKKYTAEETPDFNDLNASSVIKINGQYKATYSRLLIRKK
ncbi:MAG: adenine-specific methyltransferase EcoRI family protein [Bacteroidales bacterium]|nr:adenine-specific methyltransferase EcoRI family protein [Bacteroidales bacterium]